MALSAGQQPTKKGKPKGGKVEKMKTYKIGEFTTKDSPRAAQEVIDLLEASGNFAEVYDEMLRECYGDIEICGLTYDAATAFERIDPVAYRCGMSDFIDAIFCDIAWELGNADDDCNFYGIDVELIYN